MRPTIFPLRRSTAIALTVALVAGTLTLGGAIGLGIRLPGGWFSSAPHDTTDFDYSALGRPLKRLRHGYVEEALASAASSEPGGVGRATRRAARRTVIEFTNDDFENAYAMTALPTSVQSDTSGATRQVGEPDSCLPAGGTAWYRYEAPSDVALFADTFGSRAATTLAVFTGESLGGLSVIGCDTNILGNAQIGFRATKGVTYYFQVTSVKGGTTVFELAAVGATTLLSLSPSGEPADASAIYHPDISGDGRYVAFVSFAHNLVPTPPDCGPVFRNLYCVSLYLRDRLTGRTIRIAQQGQPYGPEDRSVLYAPSVSADGRYVAFSAYTGTPGLGAAGYSGTADDPQMHFNVFLYDRTTGRTELVSRNSAGEPAQSDPNAEAAVIARGSQVPSVSADGRYVVFTSDAKNLGGPVEPGRYENVYLRDRATGITRLVSTDANGEPIHGNSCAGSGRNVSADGRYVTFMSSTEPGTAYTYLRQVYLWDGTTGRSRLISKLPPGAKPRGTYCPAISADGSHVAMVSRDPLVPEDTNGTPDVYEYTVATGRLQRISVSSAGEQTIDPNYPGEDGTPVIGRAVTLSADGRFAVFDSAAPNLAPGAVGSTRATTPGSPGPRHVYLHDLSTGSTKLVSVSSTGETLGGDSTLPYISPDGRFVSFLNKVGSGLVNVMVHELS